MMCQDILCLLTVNALHFLFISSLRDNAEVLSPIFTFIRDNFNFQTFVFFLGKRKELIYYLVRQLQ